MISPSVTRLSADFVTLITGTRHCVLSVAVFSDPAARVRRRRGHRPRWFPPAEQAGMTTSKQ
jgi:hypothetical protein